MQTKRILTLLLVVVLTIVCGATAVAAQDEVSDLSVAVEVTSSTAVAEGACAVKPGDTVEVRVVILNSVEVGMGFQFRLGYDVNALEPALLNETDRTVDCEFGKLFGEYTEIVYDVNEGDEDEPIIPGIIQYTSLFIGAQDLMQLDEGAVVVTIPFVVKDTYHGETGFTLSDVLTYSSFDPVTAKMLSVDVLDYNTEGYIGATVWSHDFGEAVTAEATCTTPATATYTCTDKACGGELVLETAPALGHTPSAEATCTTAQICTVCQEELVAALGHTPGAEATCTTAQTCTVCQEELVAALGHTPTAEATCTTAQTCTVCDTVLVPAKGHTVVTVDSKAATCTEDGLTEGSKCSVCNEVVTEQTKIAATGHTYGDWTVKTEAAGGKEGVEERVCTVCGHAEQRAIPAAGLSTLAIVLIIIAVVVVLGGGGFCLYWFVIRKKQNA